jgi:hypothetical protein
MADWPLTLSPRLEIYFHLILRFLPKTANISLFRYSGHVAVTMFYQTVVPEKGNIHDIEAIAHLILVLSRQFLSQKRFTV